jgi:hypothetical protein
MQASSYWNSTWKLLLARPAVRRNQAFEKPALHGGTLSKFGHHLPNAQLQKTAAVRLV